MGGSKKKFYAVCYTDDGVGDITPAPGINEYSRARDYAATLAAGKFIKNVRIETYERTSIKQVKK